MTDFGCDCDLFPASQLMGFVGICYYSWKDSWFWAVRCWWHFGASPMFANLYQGMRVTSLLTCVKHFLHLLSFFSSVYFWILTAIVSWEMTTLKWNFLEYWTTTDYHFYFLYQCWKLCFWCPSDFELKSRWLWIMNLHSF